LGGIPLGDAADVEPHARPDELDGPFSRVEEQLVRANQGSGLGELLRVGQLAVSPGPPPEPADRGDGHVEDAFGSGVKLLGPLEDVEQVRADGNGWTAGREREPGKLAFRLVVAEG